MKSLNHEPLRILIALLLVALMFFLVWRASIPQIGQRQRAGVLGVVIHHSATAPTSAGKPVDAGVLDRYHARRGWVHVDESGVYHIGYHYVVLQDGTVQPGRPENATGAHSGVTHYNRHYLGICLVGDFDSSSNPRGRTGPLRPTSVQMEATVDLVVGLARRHGFGAEDIIAHRDVKSTLCPGDRFPMAELRAAVRKRLAQPADREPGPSRPPRQGYAITHRT
ncbi:MAG: N-acetylmuramoyl-L-alanine amidase [Fimbriimonadia bacterium]|jgi:N-acetyl-anhydromuramyl-L-alanine amidase AmpD